MAFIYDLTDTWNNAGTSFNGIKLNVTDTASAAGSKLIDIKIGGVSKFTVGKTGTITATGIVESTTGGFRFPDGTTQTTASVSSGTVTSVTGTGTVSGLTLTGSITTSGSLTLGGTLALTSGNVTTALGFTPYNATNPAGYTANVGTVTSVNLTAGTGVSVSGGPITSSGAITVTNTAPDQVVSLTGGGATTVTGTYPNFTITTTGLGAGTVTSVAASGGTTGLTFTGSPITTSGTLTLGGTLALANGGTGATTDSGARTALGLGTAATTNASAYATAAQGTKADTAVQTIASADGSVTITGTTAIDLSVPVTAATNSVLLPVRNTTGATLTKGTAVYISGATGQISTVSKALATSDATSAQTLGLITANLANNSNGNVTLIGTISNIDTSAYTDGAQLYLSPTTAGTLTATKPYAPQHLVYIATVEHAHPSQGKLFVKVQNGYEMDELHNVSAQSPANNDGLFYSTSTSLWEKKSIATALGYTPYNATNPSGYTTNTGTVTSVGGTGTVSGLTLTGSVTTAGDLTLGGTLSLTSGNVTTALGYTPYNATNPSNYLSTVSLTSNVTGTLPIANGGTGATTDSGARTALGLGTAAVLNSGVANGVATLDGSGTVPTSQLPGAVLGGVNYQGTWNASTNTPALASSTGSKGYYYVVSTAGSTNLNGITDWKIGDWAVYDGSTWQKVDNTDSVSSVNGFTGAVVLTTTDVAQGTNLYFTDAAARGSVSAGTGISYNSTSGVITNSAPDQTVALTGAGTTTVTGTYPNFTITSNDSTVGTVTSVGGTGTVNGLTLTGTVTTSGSLTLGGTLSGVNLTSQVTGTLPVANGGTGAATLTTNSVLLGNGTSAVQTVSPGTSGNILKSNGTTWESAAPAASGATLSNDTTTNATRYPIFADATSGAATTIYTSSPNYTFNPLTGNFSSKAINATNGFFLSDNTINQSYNVPATKNAMSVGPITIASGIAVTVSSGARWVVI